MIIQMVRVQLFEQIWRNYFLYKSGEKIGEYSLMQVTLHLIIHF